MTNDLSGISVGKNDTSTQNQSSVVSGEGGFQNTSQANNSKQFSIANTNDQQSTATQQNQVGDLPKQNQSQTNIVGGMAKEQLETSPVVDFNERVPIVETRESENVPEDVSNWMEKLEQGEEIQLPQPVTHDDQVLVTSAQNDIDEDKIVLPMTETEVEMGLHQKVFSGARWLAEWCVRLAKKFHGKVVYRTASNGGVNESS